MLNTVIAWTYADFQVSVVIFNLFLGVVVDALVVLKICGTRERGNRLEDSME